MSDPAECTSPANVRLPCQVCGRSLVPLKDGTSRNHVRHPGAEDYCQGSGYRLARWSVGQRLRHHGGSVWVVREDRDRSSRWGDYLLLCIVGTRSWSGDGWLEEPGKMLVAHGEYMHRHGWTPAEGGGLWLGPDVAGNAYTNPEEAP